MMDYPKRCEDANAILQKVLGHLDQVVEHVSLPFFPTSMSNHTAATRQERE